MLLCVLLLLEASALRKLLSRLAAASWLQRQKGGPGGQS